MIVEGLLLCIFHVVVVLSQDNGEGCSISIVTRKTCKINIKIVDSEACLNAGCCYDPKPEIPISAKCYKKNLNVISFGLSFHPTVAANQDGYQKMPGTLTVGGSPGFPGSVLTRHCDPLKKCQTQTYWTAHYWDARSRCIRQGHCWTHNCCRSPVYKFIRIRNKCPPGFQDPPACNVINLCHKNPCKNGGKCIFTGPNKFKCQCPPKYPGPACEESCKISQLAIVRGKVVATQSVYLEGEHVELVCDDDHTSQVGATSSRQCTSGQFSPSLSTHPFICSAMCGLFSDITDEQLTASSVLGNNPWYGPKHGRLLSTSGYGGWTPKTSKGEWIQVDFGTDVNVAGIRTQGEYYSDFWVTSYSVSYQRGTDTSFSNIEDKSGKTVIFDGNTERNTVVADKLDGPLSARYFRIHPVTYYNYPAMRFDLFELC